MVVLPTPVSPMTSTALLNLGSMGIEAIPESISRFNFRRFNCWSLSAYCIYHLFNNRYCHQFTKYRFD